MAKRPSNGSEVPLLAWGDARHTAHLRRLKGQRLVAISCIGMALVTLPMVVPSKPRLVWNASASAPMGLYVVRPGTTPRQDDMVIARVPKRFRTLAAQRHYLPANVPLVKRASGTSGDVICAIADRIFIAGKLVATRRSVDAEGRPLPWWAGCVRLRGGQLFLLMAGNPASFDGRYFGPTDRQDVIGTAQLVWPRP